MSHAKKIGQQREHEKIIADYAAKQERERRCKEHFEQLAIEVSIMRYDRLLREKKGLNREGVKENQLVPEIKPFGLAFASHRNDLEVKNKWAPRRVLKSKSAAIAVQNAQLSDPNKGLKAIKKEINKQGRKQLASVQTDLDVCFYCEIKMDKLTLDHIIPKCWGGVDGQYNLIYCCERCNNLKGSMSLSTFRKVILKNEGGYGLGQISLMCANVARLIHYRDTNPLMIKLIQRIRAEKV